MLQDQPVRVAWLGNGLARDLLGRRRQRLVVVGLRFRPLVLGLGAPAAHDRGHHVVVEARAHVAREQAEVVGLVGLGVAPVQLEVVLVVVRVGLGVAGEELVQRRDVGGAAREAEGAGAQGVGAAEGGEGDGAEADETLGEVHSD